MVSGKRAGAVFDGGCAGYLIYEVVEPSHLQTSSKVPPIALIMLYTVMVGSRCLLYRGL